MIEVAGCWPQNIRQPVGDAECETVIAAVAMMAPPTAATASRMEAEMLANWPWLGSTGQDLKVYVTNLTRVFAAYSIQAGRHALDPIAGLLGRSERPPSIAELRKALEDFDERHKTAARAAEWILAEGKRRQERAELHKQIEAEQAEFRAKHPGKTPLDLLRERGVVP